jgi:hypothetical protein
MALDGLADGEGDGTDGLGEALATDGDELDTPGVPACESHPETTPVTNSSPATATAADDRHRPAGIRVVRCSMRPSPSRPSSAPQETVTKTPGFAT